MNLQRKMLLGVMALLLSAAACGQEMMFELRSVGTAADGAFGFDGVTGEGSDLELPVSGAIAWDVENDDVLGAHGLTGHAPWSSFATAFPDVSGPGATSIAGAFGFQVVDIDGDWQAALSEGAKDLSLVWDLEFLEPGDESDPIVSINEDAFTRMFPHTGTISSYLNRWVETTGSPIPGVVVDMYIYVSIDSFDPLDGATGTFAFVARVPPLSVESLNEPMTLTIEQDLGVTDAATVGFVFVGTGGLAEGDDFGSLVATDAVNPIINPGGLSGLLFDPDLEGEGYNLIVGDAGSIIYFYGYSATGERLWLVSDLFTGTWEIGQPVVLTMFEANGGTFDAPAASSDSLMEWGSVSITVNECDDVTVALDGTDGQKTSDSVRLLGINGSICDR